MQMVKLKDVNCAIDQITQLIKLKLLIWSNEMIIWSIAEKGPKNRGNGQRANDQRLIWSIDLWSFVIQPRTRPA